MAKAEKFTVSVPIHPQLQLTLSWEEARFISDLLSIVGGHPNTTRRKHSAAIIEALGGAGMHFNIVTDKDGRIMKDHSGFVTFYESVEPRY